MLLSLELWKKNGSIVPKDPIQSKEISNLSKYSVFGFFDNLRLSRKNDFSEILGYYSREDLNSNLPYNRYVLPLFTIDSLKTVGDAPLCKLCDSSYTPSDKQDIDSYIYQITALKLNPEILKGYNSGMELYEYIGKEIEICLKDNLDSLFDDISYVILGGLGSFDFMLVCGIDSKKITIKKTINVKWTDMLNNIEIKPRSNLYKDINIWDALQRVSAVLRRCRDYKNKNSQALFDYSSTFYTRSFDMVFEGKSPQCHAEIRLSLLHCRKSASIMNEELNSSLPPNDGDDINKSKFIVRHMQGDEDHHITFEGQLFHLLRVLGKGGRLDISQDNNIREFHTFFINKFPPITSDDPCLSHEFPNVMPKLTYLKNYYKLVKKHIPSLIQNTVENMIFSCKYLLSNDYYMLTGIKMHSLLVSLFERISANEKNDYIQICQAIQDFSYMVPVNLQHHAVHFYDFIGIDWISPISKTLYAYEHFITSIQKNMRPNNMRPSGRLENNFRHIEMFLTVGHTEQIRSINYFDKDKLSKLDDNRLVGFNLPSISSLSLMNAYSFLIHEAAHYGIFSENYRLRNESYYHTFLSYLLIKINNEAIFKEVKKSFDDSKENLSKNDIEELRLSAFAKKLKEFSESIKNQKTLSPIARATIKDIDFNNINNVLSRIMLEIYADVFMIEICQYDFKGYTELYYNYFYDNKVNISDDTSWTIRVGSIFIYSELIQYLRNRKTFEDTLKDCENIVKTYARNELYSLENEYSDKSDCRYKYYKNIYSEVLNRFELFLEIAMPITRLASELNIRQILDDIDEGRQLYPNKSIIYSDVDTQIKFFLNHWYLEAVIRQEKLIAASQRDQRHL